MSSSASSQNLNVLRHLFAEGPFVIFAVSPDLRLLQVNPRLCDVTGHSEEQLLGGNFAEIVYPDDRNQAIDYVRSVQAGEPTPDRVEIRLQHATDERIWCRLYPTRVCEAAGVPECVVLAGVSIEETARATEERAYAVEMARCLLWHAHVYETGDPNLLNWQMTFPPIEAAQRFLPLDIVAGGTYREAFYHARHPDDRKRCDALGTASIRAGKDYEQEFRIRSAAGRDCWLHESVQVETLEAGKRWQVVGICTDVTDQRRAQETIEELNRTLERRVAELDTLLNVLPIGIAIAEDSMCRSIRANPALARMLHASPDDNISMVAPDQEHPTGFRVYHDGQEMLSEDLPMQRSIARKMEIRDFDHDVVLTDGTTQHLLGYAAPLFDEQGEVRGGVGAFIDITERNQSELEIRESETRFRTLVDELPMLVWMLDVEGDICFVNRTWLEFIGQTDQVIRNVTWMRRIHPDDQPILDGLVENSISKRLGIQSEFRMQRHDGVYRSLLHTGVPRYLADGAFLGYIGASIDVTELNTLQAQLIEAQKLESLGRLAGGVAHDFNNLLTAIMGYNELAMTSLPEDSEEQPLLANVQTAANRAANLTRQLLMYARRQMVDFAVVDINKIILGMDGLLRRTIGEQYEIVTILDEAVCCVHSNSSQIEQVLLNLVVNSRDAMPHGGRILLETQCVVLDSDYVSHHLTVVPGEYVMFSVSDTGMGMTPDVRERVFEPFFTTKEVGQGTGLGLATCYGIIKQSKGNIWVYSEPGNGTTFKVYLPRVHETPVTEEPIPQDQLPAGTETILVVDDEPMVRDATARILRTHGYRILEASDGAEALHIQSVWTGTIDLLVTDVVMPLMGGKELAQRLQQLQPDLRVLFISGYTQNSILQDGALKPGVLLLTKPFTAASLIQKVREALKPA